MGNTNNTSEDKTKETDDGADKTSALSPTTPVFKFRENSFNNLSPVEDVTATHVVAKRIQDVQSQADHLRDALIERVNVVAIDCKHMIESAGKDHSKALPNAIVKLDTFAETLKWMDAKIHGEEVAEALQADLLLQVKSRNLVSRVEKLESLLKATHEQCDSLRKDRSHMQTELISQHTMIKELQSKVTAVEKEHKLFQKDVKDLSEKQCAKLYDDTMQAVGMKMNTLIEVRKNDCTQQMDNLESKLKLALTQTNHLHSLYNSMQSKITENADTLDGRMSKQLDELRLKIVRNEAAALEFQKCHSQVARLNECKSQCQIFEKNSDSLQTQLGQGGARMLESNEDFPDEVVDGSQIAFTAQLPREWRYKKGYSLRNMDYVTCNEGNCFQAKTGKFRAPRDGLYCFALTLQQTGNNSFTAVIARNSFEDLCDVAEIAIKEENAISIVAPVLLHEGDIVFIEITKADRPITLTKHTTFSGWLIA